MFAKNESKMTHNPRLGKNYTARAHSFALLGLAAMHRRFVASLVTEARSYHNTPRIFAATVSEATRHAADARRMIANSRGFSNVEVLP